MSDFFFSLFLSLFFFFSRFDGTTRLDDDDSDIYQLNEIEMGNDPLANFQSSSLMQSDKDVNG